MAAGALVRLAGMSHECPCIDESDGIAPLMAPTFTSYMRQSMDIHGAPHPPGYFALLYYWAHIVGSDVFHLRLLSLVFGVAAIPLVFLLARQLYGTGAAFLAAVCFTFSPYEIYYSQEVRPYCVLPFLALLSVYGFIQGFRTHKPHFWMLHLLANLLLCCTHMIATLLPVAEGCYLLLCCRDRRRLLIAWGAFHFLLLAAYAYWITTLDLSIAIDITTEGETPAFLLQVIQYALLLVFMAGGLASRQSLDLDWRFPTFGDTLLAVCVYGLIAHLLLLVFRAWRRSRHPLPVSDESSAAHDAASALEHGSARMQASVFLALWAFLPPLVILVVDTVWVQFFRVRYFTFCSPAVYILLAGALCLLRSARWRICLMVLLAALYTYELGVTKSCPMRADWRTASQYILEHRQPGEPVLLTPGVFSGIVSLVSPLAKTDYNCTELETILYRVAEYCPKRAPFWVFGLFFFREVRTFEENIKAEDYDIDVHCIPGSPEIRVYHLTPHHS